MHEKMAFERHENDPPKRVIGLALASIIFHSVCPGFSRVGGTV
jgi:hypothetical protein